MFRGGKQWRSWLRHCATSRKVMGSIPNGVGIFHWHNPSGHAMALVSTQPLTEMSTRNISWGLRRAVHRADNPITFMCWLSWNLGASAFWNPQGLSRSVMGLLYLYLYMFWALPAHLQEVYVIIVCTQPLVSSLQVTTCLNKTVTCREWQY